MPSAHSGAWEPMHNRPITESGEGMNVPSPVSFFQPETACWSAIRSSGEAMSIDRLYIYLSLRGEITSPMATSAQENFPGQDLNSFSCALWYPLKLTQVHLRIELTLEFTVGICDG